MGNNYNKEMILAWDGNLDIQVCLDFFAIVTYISDYYSKDDSGTIKFLKEAAKDSQNDSLKNQMRKLKDVFLRNRTMGEAEAFYRLFPDLHLKESNLKSVFVPTGFKENRSKFLNKVPEDLENSYDKSLLVCVEGKESKYIEKSSILEKYLDKPDILKDMCYGQFAQRYEPTKS